MYTSIDHGRVGADAEARTLAVCQALLEKGADVHQSSLFGGTPLGAAVSLGLLRVAKLLLDAGAGGPRLKRTAEGEEGEDEEENEKMGWLTKGPVAEAARRGDTAMVRLLLDSGFTANDDAGSNSRDTPLSAAAEGGHVDVLRLLLSRGADVNGVSDGIFGQPAIHKAAEKGHVEALKLLLAADGLDLDLHVLLYGPTVRHALFGLNDRRGTRALLEAGVRPPRKEA